MAIENNIVSAGLFVYTILLIILQGVLLREFFSRSRRNRKGILLYVFLVLGVAMFTIADTLRNLGADLPVVVLWIIPFLAVLLGFAILWTAYYVGEVVSKKASFILFLSGFVVLAFEILRNHYSHFAYVVIESIVIGFAILLFWFMVMDFLINSSKRGR